MKEAYEGQFATKTIELNPLTADDAKIFHVHRQLDYTDWYKAQLIAESAIEKASKESV